ncbi:MAG: hypothetical protein ACLPIX_03480 [Rhodomicrobium sp.]
MRRWKLAVAGTLACVLGVVTAFVLQKYNATPADDQLRDAKVRADQKNEPDLGVVQATYDFELKSGNPLHDKNLKIIKTKCLKTQDAVYACFISFYSSADAGQRIYNGMTQLAYTSTGWVLTSGLCKRREGPYRPYAPPA